MTTTGLKNQSHKEHVLLSYLDGYYIKEHSANFCFAALVFECIEGRGRIIGSFDEQRVDVCAHLGNLLGLMAKHLILLVANTANQLLKG